MEKIALYRYWSKEGGLLYIGQSSNPLRRFGNHRRNKASTWSIFSIAKITIEFYETRLEAQEAEKIAIKKENPLHNRRHAERSLDMDIPVFNNSCMHNPTLDEKAAAPYIGMSVSFLRKSRSEGNVGSRTPGPPYIKIGRAVRYRVADLDAWLFSFSFGGRRLH